MSQEHSDHMPNSFLSGLWRPGASFVGGVIAGGMGIPFLHNLIYSNTDPFVHGWPICLQASAFLTASAWTWVLRSPIVSALGLYLGLVGFMLVSGGAEYPVASAIGLAIHALLPAVLGAISAYGMVSQMRQAPIVADPTSR